MLDTFACCLSASAIQSSTLFWIKPIIKSQYVYGGSLSESFNFLKKNGGIPRFYQGFLPAVLKSSIGRTSDITIYKTFNEKYGNNYYYSSLNSGCLSALVKIAIMPLDTLSNIYQVHGKDAYKHIRGNLYRGALAYGAIHSISSTCWLLSYSKLKEREWTPFSNLNYLLTGFTSSLITDTIVNPLRVLKTNKQVFANNKSYVEILQDMIKDKMGLYRGYRIRLGYNAINGGLFVLFWQNFEMIANKRY